MGMAIAANTTTPAIEVEEDFEVIIDEPYVSVVRMGKQYAANVHSPIDLVELGYQLAAAGFMIQDMIAFHDGVIEMSLRPIADVNGSESELDAKRMDYIREHQEKEEMIYA